MTNQELAQAMQDASEICFIVSANGDEILTQVKGKGENLINVLVSIMQESEDFKSIMYHAVMLNDAFENGREEKRDV